VCALSPASESVPSDEIYEKAVCLATSVFVLEGDKADAAKFVPIHEGSMKMISVNMLQPKCVSMSTQIHTSGPYTSKTLAGVAMTDLVVQSLLA
jgi:hypothetical protein